MNTEETIITQRQLAHEKLTRFDLLVAKLKIVFSAHILDEYDAPAMREKINRFETDKLTTVINKLDKIFTQFECIENDDSIEVPQKD